MKSLPRLIGEPLIEKAASEVTTESVLLVNNATSISNDRDFSCCSLKELINFLSTPTHENPGVVALAEKEDIENGIDQTTTGSSYCTKPSAIKGCFDDIFGTGWVDGDLKFGDIQANNIDLPPYDSESEVSQIKIIGNSGIIHANRISAHQNDKSATNLSAISASQGGVYGRYIAAENSIECRSTTINSTGVTVSGTLKIGTTTNAPSWGNSSGIDTKSTPIKAGNISGANIDASGAVTAGSLTVTGSTTCNNNLTVNGASNLQGNVTVPSGYILTAPNLIKGWAHWSGSTFDARSSTVTISGTKATCNGASCCFALRGSGSSTNTAAYVSGNVNNIDISNVTSSDNKIIVIFV